MENKKVTCNNASCRHRKPDGTCSTSITITSSGECGSFEKGFIYYFHLVWRALEHKNYIDAVELAENPDLRLGLYYVMKCYGLGFSEMEFGTSRIVMLKDGENGEGLNYKKITAREMNMETLRTCFEEFQNENRPKIKERTQPEVKEKPFGWLSPTGEFTKSPFGHHEESAEMICGEKGFVEEYWKWVEETGGNEIRHLMRDFLVEVKGYCLIHNPSMIGGYIVTRKKNPTRAQREFLYGYFMDLGDRFKAEQFLE